jgi:hypothetical protein
VAAVNKISSGASRLIRHHRSGYPPPEAAPGEVPHANLSAHQGGNDKSWHSRPEDVLHRSVRCRSAREKSRLGQPLGKNTRALVVTYSSTKTMAIGCHDLRGETSAVPTSTRCLTPHREQWITVPGHQPEPPLQTLVWIPDSARLKPAGYCMVAVFLPLLITGPRLGSECPTQRGMRSGTASRICPQIGLWEVTRGRSDQSAWRPQIEASRQLVD